MLETSETLLDRVRAMDAQGAWREFYELYSVLILRYAYKLGLDEHQAQDVLQETMVTLMRVLPEFRYDRSRGKFRSFLLRTVHNRARHVWRLARREPALMGAGDEALDWIPAALRTADEVVAEQALREALLEEALVELRRTGREDALTWRVFEGYALHRRSASEVARECGVAENYVYVIKNRILRKLQACVEERAKALELNHG